VAILEAIKLATHKGYDQVVFESDSQTLNAIYAKRVGIFEFRSVITSIRALLNVFLNFKVKFIRNKRIWLLKLWLGRPIIGIVIIFLILLHLVLTLF
jgi:hypothetical protein